MIRYTDSDTGFTLWLFGCFCDCRPQTIDTSRMTKTADMWATTLQKRRRGVEDYKNTSQDYAALKLWGREPQEPVVSKVPKKEWENQFFEWKTSIAEAAKHVQESVGREILTAAIVS